MALGIGNMSITNNTSCHRCECSLGNVVSCFIVVSQKNMQALHQFLVLESGNVETNTNPSTDFIDFVVLANLTGICANCISPKRKLSLKESPDRSTNPEV